MSDHAGAAIAIEGTSVVVTPSSGKGRPATVSGTHGTPLSLAVTGDGAYVFGIFDGPSPELAMIDLNTCTVWAIFPLTAHPATLSIAQ